MDPMSSSHNYKTRLDLIQITLPIIAVRKNINTEPKYKSIFFLHVYSVYIDIILVIPKFILPAPIAALSPGRPGLRLPAETPYCVSAGG